MPAVRIPLHLRIRFVLWHRLIPAQTLSRVKVSSFQLPVDKTLLKPYWSSQQNLIIVSFLSFPRISTHQSGHLRFLKQRWKFIPVFLVKGDSPSTASILWRARFVCCGERGWKLYARYLSDVTNVLQLTIFIEESWTYVYKKRRVIKIVSAAVNIQFEFKKSESCSASTSFQQASAQRAVYDRIKFPELVSIACIATFNTKTLHIFIGFRGGSFLRLV